MDVGITGATGLVGTALQETLRRQGHEVHVLTRGDGPRCWLPMTPSALRGLDAVVHLAGESIARGRWTDEKKRRIIGSRVEPTRRLAQAIAARPDPPILLSASAVGWYGDQGDSVLTPDLPPGDGFAADVCRLWEAACDPAREATRVVNMRFGIILSPEGGALARMLPAFKAGAGGPLGNGRQWMPWIGRHDAADTIAQLLETNHDGPVNVVADAVRQRAFARVLGRVLRRPAIVPLPAPVVRLMFGQMGQELLLASQRAQPSFSWPERDLERVLRIELDR